MFSQSIGKKKAVGLLVWNYWPQFSYPVGFDSDSAHWPWCWKWLLTLAECESHRSFSVLVTWKLNLELWRILNLGSAQDGLRCHTFLEAAPPVPMLLWDFQQPLRFLLFALKFLWSLSYLKRMGKLSSLLGKSLSTTPIANKNKK